MLTTVDNPYDPRIDYDKWLKFDHDNGYYTQELLARVAPLVENEEDNDDLANDMVDEAQKQIVDADMLGIYKILPDNDEAETVDS